MPETTAIVTNDHFTDLREQIASYKEINKNTVFDYEDKKGNKAARSHVQTLRTSKTAIANRHKEKKAQILKDGRSLDAGKNELTADVEEMIEVHAAPLRRIKEREDAAIEAAKELEKYHAEEIEAYAEGDLFNRERDIRKKEEAERIKEEERAAQEEAERIKKQQEAHEAKLRKEAAEQATKNAEEKARKEKQEAEAEAARLKAEAEKKIADAKAAEEKAEQDKKDAEERERLAEVRRAKEKEEAEAKALRDKQEAEDRRIREAKEAEQKRLDDIKAAEEKAAEDTRKAVSDEQARQAAEKKAADDAQDEKDRQDAARADDTKNRTNKKTAAKLGFIAAGFSEADAIKAVTVIVKGDIEGVTLKF